MFCPTLKKKKISLLKSTVFYQYSLLGLDPAGPFFSNKDSALDKDDAKYVDVIHTNAGGAGR